MTDKPALAVVPFPQNEAAKIKGQTPLELLEELVADVRAGKVTIAKGPLVFWLNADGRPQLWRKSVSTLEQIGYGELVKQMAMDEWREG